MKTIDQASYLAHYLDLYVKAARGKEELRRRARTAYLEIKLLSYTLGTYLHEEIRKQMVEN